MRFGGSRLLIGAALQLHMLWAMFPTFLTKINDICLAQLHHVQVDNQACLWSIMKVFIYFLEPHFGPLWASSWTASGFLGGDLGPTRRQKAHKKAPARKPQDVPKRPEKPFKKDSQSGQVASKTQWDYEKYMLCKTHGPLQKYLSPIKVRLTYSFLIPENLWKRELH